MTVIFSVHFIVFISELLCVQLKPISSPEREDDTIRWESPPQALEEGCWQEIIGGSVLLIITHDVSL